MTFCLNDWLVAWLPNWFHPLNHSYFVDEFCALNHRLLAETQIQLLNFTGKFGLFTEIAVCKFLRGWRSYGLKPFYFVHCMCLYIFLQLFVRRIVP